MPSFVMSAISPNIHRAMSVNILLLYYYCCYYYCCYLYYFYHHHHYYYYYYHHCYLLLLPLLYNKTNNNNISMIDCMAPVVPFTPKVDPPADECFVLGESIKEHYIIINISSIGSATLT